MILGVVVGTTASCEMWDGCWLQTGRVMVILVSERSGADVTTLLRIFVVRLGRPRTLYRRAKRGMCLLFTKVPNKIRNKFWPCLSEIHFTFHLYDLYFCKALWLHLLHCFRPFERQNFQISQVIMMSVYIPSSSFLPLINNICSCIICASDIAQILSCNITSLFLLFSLTPRFTSLMSWRSYISVASFSTVSTC